MIDEKTPKETWENLKNDGNAVLIDVRTPEEWAQVGYPELASIGKQVVKVSLQTIQGERNRDFVSQLQEAGITPKHSLYFICRSGKRSMMSAQLAQQAGFATVINVKDGFEGPSDIDGKTGKIAGWLAEQLPYTRL
ncbi:rhodanese-like domain-containing protein [Commensalibacter oyaizuii]|uniref:Rhodanese-like domain-containing protein n=1 Tax=Commensalibacter oyaizuii TaxID=3043873 RepID=A0ABT6Q1G1_9PROT|nr:rhodanese-like domain-containing protein [Commensalibacter sp. TBRC 16381]MDI2090952.1 rhodanese-like domain-containing protein [Commensalibacter sp. TBRC 16381]